MKLKTHHILPLLISGLLFFSPVARGQYSNEFRVGDYVEFLLHDSIKVYFNCTGKICRESCADYYRTGEIDPERINFTGEFRDYYLNDSMAFLAVMDSGYLDGNSSAWYPNGRIKSTGHYRKGERTGIWKFYYENGQVMQVLNYVEGYPFISAYFNEKGRQLVHDGAGSYSGEYYTYRTCEPLRFKGRIKSGVLDGKVKIYSSLYRGVVGYEYYDAGKFVSGISGNYNYKDAPKIELPGYNVHEQLLLDENTMYCPGFLGTSFPLYEKDLYWKFYSILLDSIQKNIKYRVEDQWLAIGIGIGFDDKLYDVNVYSSKDNYRLEKDIFNLLIEMNDWETAKVFWRKMNTDLFFTIMITHGRMIIPAELMWQQNIR